MRLDHLLSKERREVVIKDYRRKSFSNSWSEDSVLALFNFEDARRKNGGVAQLGEHLLCKQGVRSSILLISTKHGLIAQVVRAHA